MTDAALTHSRRTLNIRRQLIGAVFACIASIAVLELFRRAAWPGPVVAQWSTFGLIAWITNSRGHPLRVWFVSLLIWLPATLLSIWIATRA